MAIQGSVLVHAEGPAEGDRTFMTAHRAEACGGLSAAYFINIVESYCELTNDITWTVGFDAKKIIKRLQVHQPTALPMNLPLHADFDVTAELSSLLENYEHTVVHVKGHQDRNKPFSKLSLEAKLNVLAHNLAVTQHCQMRQPAEDVKCVGNCAQLRIANRAVTSNIVHNLCEAAQRQDQTPYLCDRFGWTLSDFHSIDWDSFCKAFTTSMPENRIRVVNCKFIHGWLPTAKRLHRESNNTYPQQCALCHHPVEDNYHSCRVVTPLNATSWTICSSIWRRCNAHSKAIRCCTICLNQQHCKALWTQHTYLINTPWINRCDIC